MKTSLSLIILSILFTISSCINGQNSNVTKTLLSVKEFNTKMLAEKNYQLVDVRTPEEFAGGHIDGALNLDWRGAEFKNQMATLDKSVPVYIYCLSGGRSGEAATFMRKEGFQQVIELEGGMMKWRSEGLKEVATAEKKMGMTKDEFNKMINVDKVVLVDFYAEWCAPCKKMKPSLEALAEEMKDKLIVQRVNIEENTFITNELHISALPVVHLYKNGKLVYDHVGFLDKATLQAEIEKVK